MDFMIFNFCFNFVKEVHNMPTFLTNSANKYFPFLINIIYEHN